MRVSSEQADWINEHGYKHLFFVSWSGGSGSLIEDFVCACKERVEDSLGLSELPGKAFFDRTSLPTGTLWQPALAEAICQSICLVAFYSNSYRVSEWCGAEFNTMHHYGKTRLGEEHGLILPVRCWGGDVPEIDEKFQRIDISEHLLSGERSFRSRKWFGRLVETLVVRIDDAAQRLAAGQQAAHCREETLQPNYFKPVRRDPPPFRS